MQNIGSRGLAAYEAVASKVAGTYSVGGTLTLADICLIPQVYNANRFWCRLRSVPDYKEDLENLYGPGILPESLTGNAN